MCDRNSRKASLLRCCIVRQKICCIVLLTTDSAAMSAPSKLLLMPRSVTVLNHVDQVRHCKNNSLVMIIMHRHMRFIVHSQIMREEAYTMATPKRTVSTEAMTGRVKRLFSQKSLHQTRAGDDAQLGNLQHKPPFCS